MTPVKNRYDIIMHANWQYDVINLISSTGGLQELQTYYVNMQISKASWPAPRKLAHGPL